MIYHFIRYSSCTIKIEYGVHSNYAIRYDDGSIVYDRPEALPKWVKRHVTREFRQDRICSPRVRI